VGVHGLLVEQVGHAAVVTYHEDDVVLVVLVVGELGDVNAGGPGDGHGKRVAGRPVAGYEAGGGIWRAGGLAHAAERAYVLQEAPSGARIPAHAVDVHGVGLSGVGGHAEGDRVAP